MCVVSALLLLLRLREYIVHVLRIFDPGILLVVATFVSSAALISDLTCVLSSARPRTGCAKNFLIYRQLRKMLAMKNTAQLVATPDIIRWSATKNVHRLVDPSNDSLLPLFIIAKAMHKVSARMPSRNYPRGEAMCLANEKKKCEQKPKNHSSLVWLSQHYKIIYWCQLFRTFEELPFKK